MKKILAAAGAAALLVGLSVAPAQADPPDCNWGNLTSQAIADGFAQGPHASDPSGDGKGPGDADQPRAGLANVVERGNLAATCDFIAEAL